MKFLDVMDSWQMILVCVTTELVHAWLQTFARVQLRGADINVKFLDVMASWQMILVFAIIVKVFA